MHRWCKHTKPTGRKRKPRPANTRRWRKEVGLAHHGILRSGLEERTVMVPGKRFARRRRDGSASRSGFPRASNDAYGIGVRQSAGADRRWLLALGHDENEEAASHDGRKNRAKRRSKVSPQQNLARSRPQGNGEKFSEAWQGQMNERAEKPASPNRRSRPGLARDHSPALTWLSLVGLLFSRAQLRFPRR
jgi:hypothetical protein